MRYCRMKPIAFTATSARQWAKLSPDVRSRIDRRLTEFATTGHGDVKRLKGRDGYAASRRRLARDLLRRSGNDRRSGGRTPARNIRLRGRHECSISENATWRSRNPSEKGLRAFGRQGSEADEDAGHCAYRRASARGNCRRWSVAAERRCRSHGQRRKSGTGSARMARHHSDVSFLQDKSKPGLYFGYRKRPTHGHGGGTSGSSPTC